MPRPGPILTAAALFAGLLAGCGTSQDGAAESTAESTEDAHQTQGVSARIHEAEAASGMSRQASPSYLGATMRARGRATDVLGRANTAREERVREEREFDRPRGD